MLLIAIAHRAASPLPDPVPHAMVLTGILVAVSATALALVLINRLGRPPRPPSTPDDHGQ
jgi:multicomponent Na+:H+ antiporter subunit C